MAVRLGRRLRVVVGLSGGVDSSVAALLLKRAGFDVQGCFVKSWDAGDEAGAGLRNEPCPVEEDWASARAVAAHLDIPLSRADFTAEYWGAVFEPALQAYASGLTPNPDVSCNRHVKFGPLRTHALSPSPTSSSPSSGGGALPYGLGGDAFATGHWAQVWPAMSHEDPFAPIPAAHWLSEVEGGWAEGGARSEDGARLEDGARSEDGAGPRMPSSLLLQQPRRPLPRLLAAADGSKDQSDFLSMVPRSSLRRVMFPLGRHTKAQVRSIAAAAGLPTAARKDSVGICFVGKRELGPFLAEYLPPRGGGRAAATGRDDKGLDDMGQPPGGTPLFDLDARTVVGHVPMPEALTPGQRARVSGQPEALFVVSVRLPAPAPAAPPSLHTQRAGGREGQGAVPGTDDDEAVVLVAAGQHHPALYCDAVAVRIDQTVAEGGEREGIGGLGGAALAAAALSPSSALRGDIDAEALAAWLRSEHMAAEAPSQGRAPAPPPPLPPPASLPLVPLRLLYRDRHRHEELRRGSAVVARRSVWDSACAALALPDRAFLLSGRSRSSSGRSSGAEAHGGRVETRGSGEDPQLLVVRFDAPHRAPAPGQVLVLYEERKEEGGGASGAAAAQGEEQEGGGARPPAYSPESLCTTDGAFSAPVAAPAPQWNGAGLAVLAAGPIMAVSPSWWAQGYAGGGSAMPAHLRHMGGGSRPLAQPPGASAEGAAASPSAGATAAEGAAAALPPQQQPEGHWISKFYKTSWNCC